jgi:hypothetical protein
MRVTFCLGLLGVVACAGAVFYYSRPVTESVEVEVAAPVRRMDSRALENIVPPPAHLPEMPRPFVPPVEPIVLRPEMDVEPRAETLDVLKQLDQIPGLPRVSTVAAQTAPRPDAGVQQVYMPYAPEDEARMQARRQAERQAIDWMHGVLTTVQQITAPVRNWWTAPGSTEESAEPPIAK